MPLFITYASYSNTGIKGIIDKPIDRTEAIRTLAEKAGGKLIAAYMTFPLRSLDIIIVAAAEAYACFGSGTTVECLCGGADMPAYIHHHDTEPPFMICPSCEHLAMHIKDATPHGSTAKVNFTYECSECGAEMRQRVTLH